MWNTVMILSSGILLVGYIVDFIIIEGLKHSGLTYGTLHELHKNKVKILDFP